jgi:hypothetical protein
MEPVEDRRFTLPRLAAAHADKLLPWLFVAVLAASLWMRLADYMTIDESLWLNRFNWYAVNMARKIAACFHIFNRPVNSLEGFGDSGMSNRLLVGLPGIFLSRLFHREDFDRLIVFRSVQVAEWIVLLLAYFLFSARRLRLPAVYALLMILSMPIIRGMARIINYDTTASIFSLLALAEYYVFLHGSGERRHRAFALLFGALALTSKPSGIFCLVFMAALEIHRCARAAATFSEYVRLVFREGAICTMWFGLAFAAVVPSAWMDPSSLRAFFHDLFEVIFKHPPLILAAAGFAAMLGLLGYWGLLRKLPSIELAGPWRPAVLYALPLVLLGIALCFQADHVMNFASFDEEKLVPYLRGHGLFYSRTTAHAFTYMHGSVLSRLLNFWNAAKLLLFTTPLPVLVLFGVGAYGIQGTQGTRGTWKGYWLSFILFYLAVYGALMVIPQHRYVLPCHYAVAMVAAAGLARITELPRAWRLGLHVALAASLMPQLLAAFPTDLGYANILRDRRIDNSQELAAAGNEGLWAGWGEHFLPVVDYLNALPGADTTTVIFDYRYVRNLRGKVLYGSAFDYGDSVRADWFIFSKPIVYRDRREWEYLRDHAPAKVFKTDGVTYAFLFKGPQPPSRPWEFFPLPTIVADQPSKSP